MRYLHIILLAVLVVSCKENADYKDLTAHAIVDKSIAISGGDKFGNSIISFNFRDKAYTAKRQNGEFSFLRQFKQASDSVTDILDNTGFNRMINDGFVKVEDSMAVKYTASVNSVHYFSVLPFGLNDKAVNKIRLGDEQIKSKAYYKIKVTFSEAGGGEDFEDVFVYWVNQENFKVDYLAYSYNEDDGVGMRFREAYNERYVNGLRFVDYNNYKAQDPNSNVVKLAKAFNKNALQLVSKIELEGVEVNLIDN